MITNYTNLLVFIPLEEGYFAITKYFKYSMFSIFHGRRIRHRTTFRSILSNSTSAAKTFSGKSQQRVVELKKLSKYKMRFEFSLTPQSAHLQLILLVVPLLNYSFQYKLEKRKDILEKMLETRFSFQISPACSSCTF